MISGWISWGILFRIKLIFPLTRRIPSLWNRCWVVIEPFPQVAFAGVDSSFFYMLKYNWVPNTKNIIWKRHKFHTLCFTCRPIGIPFCLVCLLDPITWCFGWAFNQIPTKTIYHHYVVCHISSWQKLRYMNVDRRTVCRRY